MAKKWQLRAPLVVLDEFLVAQERAGLLEYTLARSADFTSSGVLDAGGQSRTDCDYRSSRVLYDLEDYETMFIDRIMTYLPHVLARLRHPLFPVSRFEVQLTASNQGQFFRKHKDDDSSSVSSRLISFVYYYFFEPKSFKGGALRLYDAQIDQNGRVTPGPSQTIHPMQNQIIFFPSDSLHEILPVECATGRFRDSRFTVNGWVHQ